MIAGTDRVREVALNKGFVALVDEADWPLIEPFRWYSKRGNKNTGIVYAFAEIEGNRLGMHRLITCAPAGMEVDHKDLDGLNNRRGNLRVCTHSQNQWNQRKTRGSSQYKGVSWHKACRKWMACIGYCGRNIHLGVHVSEESAARAYDAKALELFGEFARLNFPTTN